MTLPRADDDCREKAGDVPFADGARVPMRLSLSGRRPLRDSLRSIPVPMLVLACVLGFGAICSGIIAIRHTTSARPDQALASAPPFDSQRFPISGTTLLARSDPRADQKLTLQTSPAPGGTHTVATLSDWTTARWAATVYLDANSATTIPLPVGRYRLRFASGLAWRGDTAVFGPTTRVMEAQRPLMLRRLAAGASPWSVTLSDRVVELALVQIPVSLIARR